MTDSESSDHSVLPSYGLLSESVCAPYFFSLFTLMDSCPELWGTPAKVIVLRYPLISCHFASIAQVFIATLLSANWWRTRFFSNNMQPPPANGNNPSRKKPVQKTKDLPGQTRDEEARLMNDSKADLTWPLRKVLNGSQHIFTVPNERNACRIKFGMYALQPRCIFFNYMASLNSDSKHNCTGQSRGPYRLNPHQSYYSLVIHPLRL